MELKKIFLLDQVRIQEDPMLVFEFNSNEGMSGIGYNPRLETLAFWTKQKEQKNQDFLML